MVVTYHFKKVPNVILNFQLKLICSNETDFTPMDLETFGSVPQMQQEAWEALSSVALLLERIVVVRKRENSHQPMGQFWS